MAAAVDIRYPPDGAQVPGDGGFFAWGHLTEMDPEMAQAEVSVGSGMVDRVDPPAPCNWAFRFSNVQGSGQLTLKVKFTDMNNPNVTAANECQITIISFVPPDKE